MSNVDPNVPARPVASTEDVRRNFQIIKTELEAIWAWINSNKATDSPVFTGTMDAQNGAFSGDLSVAGNLTAGAGPLSLLTGLESYVSIIPAASTTWSPGIVHKISSKFWFLHGLVQQTTGGAVGPGFIWGTFPGTISGGQQLFPISTYNTNLANDAAIGHISQSSTNVISITASIFSGGAIVNVPDGGTLAFYALIVMGSNP